MSWSCYWIDPLEVGDRIGISTTLALTVIAFNFCVNDALPRISYMTYMDTYLTFMFVSVVFTVFENVAVYRIAQQPNGTAVAEIVDLGSFGLAVLATVASTVCFMCGGSWRKSADTNNDGILDADEIRGSVHLNTKSDFEKGNMMI